jgi:hypothetical protein
MGLDMYAYVATQANDSAKQGKLVQREIAYWRKHPNLHGWMERLAQEKNVDYDSFNGVELELTWEDLEALEQAVHDNALPATTGFFFGQDSDDEYRESDLAFIRKAKAEVFLGLKVFYNSSW